MYEIADYYLRFFLEILKHGTKIHKYSNIELEERILVKKEIKIESIQHSVPLRKKILRLICYRNYE